jgi:hypothetical protein
LRTTPTNKQEVKELTERIGLLTKSKHEAMREIEMLEIEIGRLTRNKLLLLGQQKLLTSNYEKVPKGLNSSSPQPNKNTKKR